MDMILVSKENYDHMLLSFSNIFFCIGINKETRTEHRIHSNILGTHVPSTDSGPYIKWKNILAKKKKKKEKKKEEKGASRWQEGF